MTQPTTPRSEDQRMTDTPLTDKEALDLLTADLNAEPIDALNMMQGEALRALIRRTGRTVAPSQVEHPDPEPPSGY